MKPEELNALAVEAMGHAYAPYSGYQVGAALLCKDGTVYQGCNIENASFSPTVCAERTVIHGLENGGPLCTEGGAEGSILDVAALVNRAVFAQ